MTLTLEQIEAALKEFGEHDGIPCCNCGLLAYKDDDEDYQTVMKALPQAKDNLEDAIHKHAYIDSIEEENAQLKKQNKVLREALEYVTNKKDLMFTECSEAENIISICNEALKETEEK